MTMATLSYLGLIREWFARHFNRLASEVLGSRSLAPLLLRHSAYRLPAGPCRVLFVCKGNICRSAYAEATARERMRSQPGWTFSSAGLAADPGNSVPASAQSVARERGIDLSRHRARLLTVREALDIDLVLVMEPRQALHIALLPFRVDAPVVLLGAFCGSPLIPDPYGRNDDAFRESFDKIDAAITELLNRIP